MLRIYTLLGCFALSCFQAKAQLPTCTGSSSSLIYYITWPSSTSNTAIYNFDPASPYVPGINPVLNTITPPVSAAGLTVSPLLSGVGPSPTFYTVMNGNYYYYNGTTWVNTGHSSGSLYTVNPGAGGGYIFNIDGLTGDVYRYDGTGNATLLMSAPGQNHVVDISVECSGNFYLLFNGNFLGTAPKMLNKYDPNGLLLASYPLVGAPSVGYGGGLCVSGNDVYYDDTYNYMHGVISGTSVVFSAPSPALIPAANDFAHCPDAPGSIYASIDTGFYCGAGAGVPVKVIGKGPFTWSLLSGNAVITGSGDSVMVKPLTSARIIVSTGLSSPLCGSNADTVLIVPATAQLTAGPDRTLFACGNTTDTLQGIFTPTTSWITYNFLWTPSTSVISGANTLSAVINPLANTTFVLAASTGPAQGNCIWRDTVNVSVQDASVTAGFSYNAYLGCNADTVLFANISTSKAGALQYRWNFDDNGTGDTSKQTSHIYRQGIHNAMLIVNNGHCKDTATATINVDHPLEARINATNLRMCAGDTIFFDAGGSVISLPVYPPKYFWHFGEGQTDTIVNPYHQYDNANGRTVMLIVTDSINCMDTTWYAINDLTRLPYIELGPTDTILCAGEQLYLPLGISAAGDRYIWSDGSTEARHIVTKSGIYIAKLFNECGFGADTIKVEFQNCTVFFPSAFTLNGDGKNDHARIVGNLFGVTDCNISIFNRFGERVFYTNNKEQGWDGSHNGAPQPIGSYYYYIKYTLHGEPYEMKGDIALVREYSIAIYIRKAPAFDRHQAGGFKPYAGASV